LEAEHSSKITSLAVIEARKPDATVEGLAKQLLVTGAKAVNECERRCGEREGLRT
jgi:hypothetical protein